MNKLTVVDGEFTTQLRRNLGDDYIMDPYWDMRVLQTNRFAVYKTHLDFLRAGATIIRTNTTRAATPTLIRHLEVTWTEAVSLITTSVELAQKAVFKFYEERGGDTSNLSEFKKHRPLIAGSCAGFGVTAMDGDISTHFWDFVEQEDIERCHRMRMQTLLNAGVDLLAVEGISCKMEAEVVVELLRDFRTARAWITFFCNNDSELPDGSSFLEVALHCYQSLPGQIVAVGVLCSDILTEITLLEIVTMKTLNSVHLPLLMYFKADECEEKYQTASYCVHDAINLGVIYISGSPGSSANDILLIHKAVMEFYDSPGPSSAELTLQECSLQNEENKSKL